MNKIKTILLAVAVTMLLVLLVLRIINVKNAEGQGITLGKELARENGFLAAEYVPVRNYVKVDESVAVLGSAWIHEPIKLKHRLFIFDSYYSKQPDGEPSLKYSAKESGNDFVLSVARNDTALNEMFFAKNGLPELRFYSLENELVDEKGNRFRVEDHTKVDTIKLYVKKASLVPDRPIGAATDSDYVLYKIELDKEPVDSVLFVKKR
ncbi:hypothetical protein [Pontibacter virosus]|uniref:Uncharacterized protein n=1 Tax=Pontibacter virosus TaxID=1765052 RepID=A0A2U1AUK8_9BACT|nr:hypothetical protein [Pontibacter virosus]PVY40108.1 hypothetical protein C8E01_1081 [Pontibacter virosus]